MHLRMPLGFSVVLCKVQFSLSNMHSAEREATRLLETMKGGELPVNLQMKLKSYRTMYSTMNQYIYLFIQELFFLLVSFIMDSSIFLYYFYIISRKFTNNSKDFPTRVCDCYGKAPKRPDKTQPLKSGFFLDIRQKTQGKKN